MSPLELVFITVVAGILFDIANGWNDSANAIATVVSTRVLSPRRALALSASLNFLGALVSVKVARTMGAGVVSLPVETGSLVTVLSAMLAATAWVAWCTRMGLPISCSHALVGGIVGAVAWVGGWNFIQWAGVLRILAALLVSPFLGFLFGYGALMGLTWLAHSLETTSQQGRKVFGFLQLCSSSFVAFEHGKNDAQKVMGVIALGLFTGGFLRDEGGRVISSLDRLYVPLWVKLVCASAIALGTGVGGWRVIRTLGTRLVKISPLEGCCAETAAGAVLEAAASLGVPVSTTHTLTGGIVGVGAVRGARAVKWGLGAKILYAWIFTLPVTFLIGGFLAWLSRAISPIGMVLTVAGLIILLFLGPLALRIARRGRGLPGPAAGSGSA